jgi:hypothetical protein
MLPAVAGFKFKGNSAGQQNWTAAKLPFRARDMDVPSQRENFNHPSTICQTCGAGIHTLSILRIALKVSATLHSVSLRAKFEPDIPQ